MTSELEFEAALSGKRVFVTGHSGFTGSWLCAFLQQAGVDLFGYSLAEEQPRPLEFLLGSRNYLPSVGGDLLDFPKMLEAMQRYQPQVIIHLAAQPLVRLSYREPLATFSVNALGTANVLEAARLTPGVRGIVCITTDKVYENKEWQWAYRENDPLGGKDPYSASKSAAEMIITGYASVYALSGDSPRIAIARGGNIIGGGDWSEDRLIPDFVRAVTSGNPLTLRFPEATRPWQHVLALVQGYSMLAAGLLSDDPKPFARAWNFGPQDPRQYSVRHALEIISEHWKRPDIRYLDEPMPEAGMLALDSRLAFNALRWDSPWNVGEMIKQTALWYREHARLEALGQAGEGSMMNFTVGQINAWRSAVRASRAG